MSSGRLLRLGGQTQKWDVNPIFTEISPMALTSRTCDLLDEHFNVRLLTLPSNHHWNETKTGRLLPKVMRLG